MSVPNFSTEVDITAAIGNDAMTNQQRLAALELLKRIEDSGIVTQCSTVSRTNESSVQIPIITDTPRASWVNEGDEIPVTSGKVAELTIRPSKLAALSVITSELALDSTPAALDVVTNGLTYDITNQMDAAFLGDLEDPAQAGLESLEDVTELETGGAITSTDPFVSAIASANQAGTNITHWIAHPDDALALARIKKGTGSNEPLLGNDPTQPTQRIITGVPLLVSNHVTPGHIWGVPKDRVFTVFGQGLSLKKDESAFFTSDRVALRATVRVGFGFVQPAAIVKIITNTGG